MYKRAREARRVPAPSRKSGSIPGRLFFVFEIRWTACDDRASRTMIPPTELSAFASMIASSTQSSSPTSRNSNAMPSAAHCLRVNSAYDRLGAALAVASIPTSFGGPCGRPVVEDEDEEDGDRTAARFAFTSARKGSAMVSALRRTPLGAGARAGSARVSAIIVVVVIVRSEEHTSE